MVEKFLCPGCVCGSNTECGHYKEPTDGYDGCLGHCLGTRLLPAPGLFALGMPKGFNRPGWFFEKSDEPIQPHHMVIRLLPKTTNNKFQGYDWLNVPVWALEQDGFLFVRTMCPRVGMTYIDVFEGGKAEEICPQAINVTDRYAEYD